MGFIIVGYLPPPPPPPPKKNSCWKGIEFCKSGDPQTSNGIPLPFVDTCRTPVFLCELWLLFVCADLFFWRYEHATELTMIHICPKEMFYLLLSTWSAESHVRVANTSWWGKWGYPPPTVALGRSARQRPNNGAFASVLRVFDGSVIRCLLQQAWDATF